jgi:predicted CopG family antitoxin
LSAKTVALDVEAYEMLRRQRRTGETFSETVKRLSGKRRSILAFAGVWKDIPAKDLERIRSFLSEGRRRDRERTERLFRSKA